MDKEDFPPLQPSLLPPPRSTEEVMDELREVTYQYTNVADPVESAARKHRVLNGEAYGLVETTAASIMEAELLAQQSYLAARAAEAPTEEMMIPQNTSNLPLTTTQPAQQSKKRGRPPKQRDLRISPKVFKGESSRKRNLTMASASPANKSGKTSRRTNIVGNSVASTNSNPTRPKTQLFPASKRQPRDFPRLSPPLPILSDSNLELLLFGKSHNSPATKGDPEEDLTRHNFPIGNKDR